MDRKEAVMKGVLYYVKRNRFERETVLVFLRRFQLVIFFSLCYALVWGIWLAMRSFDGIGNPFGFPAILLWMFGAWVPNIVGVFCLISVLAVILFGPARLVRRT
jgi:hypothetical protein